MFSINSKVALCNADYDILTFGELLIDMVGTNNRGILTYHQFFGGSPANIAMNAKRLGLNALACSAVGNDRFGDYLINTLESANVSTKCVQRTDAATSMVVLNQSNGTPKPIFYRGADYIIEYNDVLEEAVRNSKIIHFSTWPLSKSPAYESLMQAIDSAKKENALICFDPNFHPDHWGDPEKGKEIVKNLIGKTSIVKPSDDDAERLFGADTNENQIEKFHKLGAKLVIMTLGKDGLIISDGNDIFKMATMATEVTNTTGAGDAFWAGFYAAIIDGSTIKDACRYGSAASAFKLKYLSSIAELPTLNKLKEMYSL